MTTLPPTARAPERVNSPSGDAVEFDLFRLDCAVDALRGADLSPYRPELRRIADNLNDLMETPNGHAH